MINDLRLLLAVAASIGLSIALGYHAGAESHRIAVEEFDEALYMLQVQVDVLEALCATPGSAR